MNRFELLRYERGLTRGEVKAGTGLAYPTLKALEESDDPKPTAPVAKALADFYGMPVAEFLGLVEAPTVDDSEAA